MRVYAEPDDQTLKEINEEANELHIRKADLILRAIDQFLHPSDQALREAPQSVAIERGRGQKERLVAILEIGEWTKT